MTSGQAPHLERSLADDFFAGALAPARFDQLFIHLRGCDDCRDHFEQVRRGYRAMSPPGPGLARHEADLLKQQLVAEFAPAKARTSWLEKWSAAFGALAAVTAAALVTTFVPADEGFTAKGGAAPVQAELVKLLCMSRVGADDVAVKAVPQTSGKSTCGVGQFLMVAASAPTPPAEVTVVVLDSLGGSRYISRRSRPEPQQLFEGYVQLTDPGAYQVVAMSSEGRIDDLRAVDAAKAGAARKKLEGVLDVSVTSLEVVR
jgi:hypothetical protein